VECDCPWGLRRRHPEETRFDRLDGIQVKVEIVKYDLN
jgi:hypothetical protein